MGRPSAPSDGRSRRRRGLGGSGRCLWVRWTLCLAQAARYSVNLRVDHPWGRWGRGGAATESAGFSRRPGGGPRAGVVGVAGGESGGVIAGGDVRLRRGGYSGPDPREFFFRDSAGAHAGGRVGRGQARYASSLLHFGGVEACPWRRRPAPDGGGCWLGGGGATSAAGWLRRYLGLAAAGLRPPTVLAAQRTESAVGWGLLLD